MMNRARKVLEFLGRAVLNSKGVILLILAISIGPIFSFLFLTIHSNEYQDLVFNYQKTAAKARIALQNRERKDQFIEAHLKSDPSYLSEHLESMEFLTSERQILSELSHHPAIGDRDAIKKRLISIEKKQNHLSFNEGEILTSKSCIETLEQLKEPVEISSEDLRNLIQKIEFSKSEVICPQFMIVKFHLSRIATNDEIRNKLTELDLLKREFIKQ